MLVLVYLAAVPAAALLLRFLHGKYKGKRPPWKYIYSVLVYQTCIPGVFAVTVTVYSWLFLHANLLTLDIFIYYLPIISMLLTLFIISRSVPFKFIPGFERIYGLIILLELTFLITIFIDRLRVFISFRGSVLTLFLISAAVFFLLKYAEKLLFGQRKNQ
jgi:hypothetical protein